MARSSASKVGNQLGSDITAAYGAVIVMILLALIVSSEPVSWLLGIATYLTLAYTMTRVPLRVSLVWMMFCGLALENPSELPAAGQWKSPLFPVGALMLTHMNGLTGVSWLFFSGMDLCIVTLLVIALARHLSGSQIDSIDRVLAPSPLVRLAFVSLAGTAYTWIVGMLKGGNNSFAIWQIDRVIYLPVLFFLFNLALRGPSDHFVFARTLVAAGVIRSLQAAYVMNTVRMPGRDGDLISVPYATSHHDSVLFALTVILLCTAWLNRYPGARKRALILLPVLVLGMINNNRRMVWVQIGLAFLTLYLATPMTPLKLKIRKFVWILIPLMMVYVAVGWNQPTGIFSPVKTVRSVVDPQTDASAQTREIENYNLICTIRGSPVLGIGYGNPYMEVIGLPPMGYDLEPYVPHNSILGLWSYCGYFGFTALIMLWTAGVFFAMRAYNAARTADHRIAAMLSYASVLVYLVQCWGDIGLGSWTGVFTVSAGIAFGGKLCVVSGAWLGKRRLPDGLGQESKVA